MADQIFECPFCLGHFLVPSDSASGRTLCPHCSEVLDMHGLLEGMDSTNASSALPSPQAEASKIQAIVTDCPSCSGKFQVLASMHGQLVACPHCQARLRIAPPTSAAEILSDYKIQTGEQSPAGLTTAIPGTESQFPKPKRKSTPAKPAPAKEPPNVIVSEATSSYDLADANKSAHTGTEQIGTAAVLASETKGGPLDPELEKLLPPKFIVP